MASRIKGQGSDVPECLIRDGKHIIELDYSDIKKL